VSADHHDVWIAHILRREAEALILQDRPALLERESLNEAIDAESRR
jgi:hypothetical protein